MKARIISEGSIFGVEFIPETEIDNTVLELAKWKTPDYMGDANKLTIDLSRRD